jgi:hypothetical protein
VAGLQNRLTPQVVLLFPIIGEGDHITHRGVATSKYLGLCCVGRVPVGDSLEDNRARNRARTNFVGMGVIAYVQRGIILLSCNRNIGMEAMLLFPPELLA